MCEKGRLPFLKAGRGSWLRRRGTVDPQGKGIWIGTANSQDDRGGRALGSAGLEDLGPAPSAIQSLANEALARRRMRHSRRSCWRPGSL